MKKAPLVIHENHNVIIEPSNSPPHEAYYKCLDCDKWVSWLSKKEAESARSLGLLRPKIKNLKAQDLLG